MLCLELRETGPLAHAVFRRKQDVFALDIEGNGDNLVVRKSKAHAGYAHGAAAGRTDFLFIEADAVALFGDQDDLAVAVRHVRADQLVIFPEGNGNDARLLDMLVLGQGSLLDQAFLRRHQQVLRAFKFFHCHGRCDLFARHQLQEVYDRGAPGIAGGLRDLIAFHLIDAACIGEEQDAVVGGGDEHALDHVLFQGLHAPDALAAPVLGLEGVDEHTLDIAEACHGDHGIAHRDQILVLDLAVIDADLRLSLVSVFFLHDEDLFPDHAEKFLFICQDLLVIFDLRQKFCLLVFQFLAFQTGEGTQPHIHDGLGLHVCQTEPLHQPFFGFLRVGARTDDADHLVNVVQGDQQACQDVGPFFRLVQVVFRPSGDHFLLVLQIKLQHFQKGEDLRFVIDQGQHDHAKAVLQLGVFVQLVQDNIGIGVFSELDHHPDTGLVCLVPEVRDAVDPFVLDQFADLFHQLGLVDQEGQFRHDDIAFAVVEGLDLGHGADLDLAAAGTVRLFNAFSSQDRGAGRKIRSFHDLHDVVDRDLFVFHLAVDDLYHSIDQLPDVMGRDVGRHTDRDACGAVGQEVRVSGGKHRGLLFRLVKVRYEIHRILADIRQHFHGDLREPCLGITHGGCPVSVLGAEVAVSVYQRVTGRPFLGHIDQRSVDGGVSVGMIFTHGITDDTGAFPVRLVRRIVQFTHGEQHTPLYRLEAVPHIRQRSGSDDAHGVVDVRRLHGLLEVDLLDLVKYRIA